MNCRDARRRLLDVRLGEAERDEDLDAHLVRCSSCRREAVELEDLLSSLRKLGTLRTPSAFRGRLRRAVEAAERRETEALWRAVGPVERLRAHAAFVWRRTRESRAAAVVLTLAAAQLLALALWSLRGEESPVPPGPDAVATLSRKLRPAKKPAPSPVPQSVAAGEREELERVGGVVEPPDEPLPPVEDEEEPLGVAAEDEAPAAIERIVDLENRRATFRYRMRPRFSSPGDSAAERATGRALRWLRGLQREDGSIDVVAAGGEPEVTVAATALAVLAWMGDARSGVPGGLHARAVDAGVGFLRRQVTRDRTIGAVRGDRELVLFQHAVATAALVEHAVLAGSERRDPLVADVVERLADLSRVRGEPKVRRVDDLAAPWVAFALELARASGVRSVVDLDRAAREARRHVVGLLDVGAGQGATPAGSALFAVECSAALDAVSGRVSLDTPRPPVDWLLPHLRDPRLREPSKLFFTTLDLYQRGGGAWELWNTELVRVLLQSQGSDGSWSTSFVWNDVQAAGGDVYTTALSAMSLTAFRRFQR